MLCQYKLSCMHACHLSRDFAWYFSDCQTPVNWIFPNFIHISDIAFNKENISDLVSN